MDEMVFTICARAVVKELEEGKQLYEMLKERLADHPEISLGGGIHYNLSPKQEIKPNENPT